MNRAVFHGIYIAIILLLLSYIARLSLSNSPAVEVQSTTAQTAEQSTARIPDPVSPDRSASADYSPANGDGSSDHLRRQLAEQARQIEGLQDRISRLQADSRDATATTPTQQGESHLSDEELEEQFHQRRAQQEAERDAAFASAAQTAQSDEVQHRLETSIYNLDNSPRFEALDVECRGVYCNIEVSFENQDDARNFMTYQGRRIFDQANVRTTMTRSESRDGWVIIKADLAPLTED